MDKEIITKGYTEKEFDSVVESKVLSVLTAYGIIPAARSKAQPEQEEYIGTNVASEFIKVSLSTLYKMVRLDEIPHHKMGGKNSKVLFKRSELDAWMKEKTNSPGAANQ